MNANMFMPREFHYLRRAVAVALLAGLILILVAAPALAHVTVAADDDTAGASDAILTFRVPNEDGQASVTKIDIRFPTRHPIAAVAASPKPGWTVTTRIVAFNPPISTDDGTITSGIGEVVYTAKSPADAIPVGEFGAFQILVGPLPDVSQIAFPTIQTYSSGKTVAWVEPVTDPRDEPEHPAPVLTLVKAESTATLAPATPSTVDLAGSATSAPDRRGTWLGVVGIVLGAISLVAVGVLARSR